MFAEILQREINAALLEIGAYVLPEVGQLQGGAGEVGKLLAFRIAVAAEIQDQVSHGIGGIAAVAEEIVERVVAGDGLVLAESAQ